MEEENITNRLNKKLLLLSGEKEQLARQIEQEEEYLTNTLQAQLNELRKEKVDMENQLEQEQECIVNKLQRQLDELRNEKSYVCRKLWSSIRELTTSVSPFSKDSEASSRGVVKINHTAVKRYTFYKPARITKSRPLAD
mmetsp:Transcript_7534/g.33592  ORF Transcript_7534/g.33592 Transcript_7534/m.33592 type:complete len:139 (-) Transcript_7534:2010-2426(-)